MHYAGFLTGDIYIKSGNNKGLSMSDQLHYKIDIERKGIPFYEKLTGIYVSASENDDSEPTSVDIGMLDKESLKKFLEFWNRDDADQLKGLILKMLRHF